MIEQLAIATGMLLLTVAFHAVGLLALRKLIRLEVADIHLGSNNLSLPGIIVTLTVVLGVFVLHGVEIWIYALLFYWVGAVPGGLHEAVYFSTITYSTVGFDDEGVSRSWELVAAIESINGIVLLGWSTAFFVSIGTRMARR